MEGQISDKVKQQRRDLAMAAQLKVARQVSESFVGRELKVLVEGEASAKELQNANISSWEHGLIRGQDKHAGQLKGRYLVARGEADAPDIDGRVYVRGTAAARRICAGQNHRPHRLRFDCRTGLNRIANG